MENPFLKNATFILRLWGKENFDKEFSCTGEQLAEVLTCINDEVVDSCWYVCDVEYNGPQSKETLFPFDVDLPMCCLEDTCDLIDRVNQVNQFASGVFVAIKKNVDVKWDINWLPETEEKEGLQHPNAEIEIRAFDYTYFEIYSNKDNIIKKLKECFDNQ